MRRHPTFRLRAALGAALLGLVFAAPPVLADVSVDPEQGRQTRTGPKQPTREYNGVLLDEPAAVARTRERPSGRTLDGAGRGVRAEPLLPVSVGIIGCPGCSEAIRDAGGVIVDGRVGRLR